MMVNVVDTCESNLQMERNCVQGDRGAGKYIVLGRAVRIVGRSALNVGTLGRHP